MKKFLTPAALLLAAGSAAAHTGHGTHSLFEGLSHPLGLDHLLAMVAVGVWSVRALSGSRRWLGPLVFVASMVAGALAGAAGLSLGFTEHGIALSVAVLGAMWVAGRQLPAAAGLALVAAAALLHGVAHGAELPANGLFASYAAGFVLSTAVLHLAGMGLAQRLHAARPLLWRLAGSALAAAGLLLLVRI